MVYSTYTGFADAHWLIHHVGDCHGLPSMAIEDLERLSRGDHFFVVENTMGRAMWSATTCDNIST